MTSLMIDLTRLGQFHIITHPEVDLVIRHLTYLIKNSEQSFESTYAINLLIKLVVSLTYGM